MSYFCCKNTVIFNHLGEKLQNFLAVVGVEEEDSSTSMLPAYASLENCCLSAFSGLEYIL